MRSKEISLSNKFSNGESYAERLRDNLARHPLVVGELATVRRRGGKSVLLHRGADQLIEVKEQLSPKVRLVIWRKNNRCRYRFYDGYLEYVLGR